MNEGLAVAFNHRRTARRLTLLAAISALFLCASSAVALDGVVDPLADTTATATDTTTGTSAIDETVQTTIAPDPIATVTPDPAPVAPDPIATVTPDPAPVAPDPIATVTPDPAPVAPDPIATVTPDPAPVAPDPIATVTPDPAPVAPDPVVTVTPDPVVTPAPAPTSSAATDLTPQDVILAVHDATPVTAGDTANLAVQGSDAAATAVRIDTVESAPVGLTAASDVPTGVVATAVTEPTAKPSIITPLVVPIVQTLGPGLLTPYASPQTFGTEIPGPGSVPAAGTNAPATSQPAQASAAASGLPFGIALPTGGWSGESAGILALLMGLLPLGLPDGKSKMGGQTQLAVLLLGGLLMLIRFFASPVRDDRRRGPRGFAALALRPG